MIFVNAVGIINAIGDRPDTIRKGLLEGVSPGMGKSTNWSNDPQGSFVGKVSDVLPPLPKYLSKYECRNNRLLFATLAQIRGNVDELINHYGKDRIGIILGTSTSGISAGEDALVSLHSNGRFPENYHYVQQELGSLSECLAMFLDVKGPAYTVSTACSSSARAFVSAKQLIESDVCDAVLVGGVDTLCRLTLNGFDGLESLADGLCNPLSLNRDGINVGEGAALFLLSKKPDNVAFLGVGESSDAYHVSAPDPEGKGAEIAMRMALKDAGIIAEDVGYLNLHGTATKLNDVMEANVVARVLGKNVPCSSTKPLTGHTLGAAGAVEAALCWLLLVQSERTALPPHLWDGVIDQELSEIRITSREDVLEKAVCMSNSFAFGGNNVSLIFGKTHV